MIIHTFHQKSSHHFTYYTSLPTFDFPPLLDVSSPRFKNSSLLLTYNYFPNFFFYIYCSVHRNILWNDQQMQQCAVSLFFCKSTLHVSGGTHAHHQEYRSNSQCSLVRTSPYQATLGGSTRDDLSLTNNCTNDCRYS